MAQMELYKGFVHNAGRAEGKRHQGGGGKILFGESILSI